MSTPFDDVVEAIRKKGYHNHRQQEHSDILNDGIVRDLRARCPRIEADFKSGVIISWTNRHIPAARGKGKKGRLADLLVGPADEAKDAPSSDFRICIEHKSVVTAHRNVRARFGDLNEILEVAHHAQPHAILVATVLIGVSPRVLNVPDRVMVLSENFEQATLPRLSTGDQSLWTDFKKAISTNRPGDPERTAKVFRELPVRPFGRTDLIGYDYLLLVPVEIDNVNPPSVARGNSLGIDVDVDYEKMLDTICRAYQVRW